MSRLFLLVFLMGVCSFNSVSAQSTAQSSQFTVSTGVKVRGELSGDDQLKKVLPLIAQVAGSLKESAQSEHLKSLEAQRQLKLVNSTIQTNQAKLNLSQRAVTNAARSAAVEKYALNQKLAKASKGSEKLAVWTGGGYKVEQKIDQVNQAQAVVVQDAAELKKNEAARQVLENALTEASKAQENNIVRLLLSYNAAMGAGNLAEAEALRNKFNAWFEALPKNTSVQIELAKSVSAELNAALAVGQVMTDIRNENTTLGGMLKESIVKGAQYKAGAIEANGQLESTLKALGIPFTTEVVVLEGGNKNASTQETLKKVVFDPEAAMKVYLDAQAEKAKSDIQVAVDAAVKETKAEFEAKLAAENAKAAEAARLAQKEANRIRNKLDLQRRMDDLILERKLNGDYE